MIRHANEDASGGSLIGSVVCIGIVGTVFWVLGVANMLMASMSISQDAANTIYMFSVVFAALPFLYILAVLINYMSTASDESTGGV
jgi:hypothetical protein